MGRFPDLAGQTGDSMGPRPHLQAGPQSLTPAGSIGPRPQGQAGPSCPASESLAWNSPNPTMSYARTHSRHSRRSWASAPLPERGHPQPQALRLGPCLLRQLLRGVGQPGQA
eukprot:15432273-Alexandrium_andersonii.AAC.1